MLTIFAAYLPNVARKIFFHVDSDSFSAQLDRIFFLEEKWANRAATDLNDPAQLEIYSSETTNMITFTEGRIMRVDARLCDRRDPIQLFEILEALIRGMLIGNWQTALNATNPDFFARHAQRPHPFDASDLLDKPVEKLLDQLLLHHAHWSQKTLSNLFKRQGIAVSTVFEETIASQIANIRKKREPAYRNNVIQGFELAANKVAYHILSGAEGGT